jgi:tetratricopeptide (TPR) repeat protein
LAHHAIQAENTDLILRFAPDAARQAAARGARREAIAHYQAALRYADQMTPEQHAELLDELSYERFLTGHIGDAVPPCEEALALWRALDQPEKTGHDLHQLALLYNYVGKDAEAERYGLAAVELLETLPPGRELARAYARMSGLCMMVSDNAQAIFWGERAIALAPEDIGVRNALSICLQRLDRPAESLYHVDLLLKAHPEFSFAHANRGNALISLGALGRARASHLRALAADLEKARGGAASTLAAYSWVGALTRNAALYPVVLAHAFRVLFSR